MRHLRGELGLTQIQIADRASLDVRYYSRIENGKVNITLTTLYRLARAMKCPRLLSLAISPAEELEAGVCSSLCAMARRGETEHLHQVDKFVHHVLGVRPDSHANGCLAAIMVKNAPRQKRIPARNGGSGRSRSSA